jgi:hypothetical protein
MFETLSGCIVSIRYTNTAEILKQYVAGPADDDMGYEYKQDEYGGGIIREWSSTDPDNPNSEPLIIPCLVRPPTATAKGTEAWGQIYENMQSLQMQYNPSMNINLGDQIANITAQRGNETIYPWTERNGEPTTYDVVGLSPIFGPFGDVMEMVAVLERVEIQNG